ncbi:N-acetylmuramoyl-L-alanine amidase [Geodermatophilus bullaregiensis]|uniref:N-acetylmuramoyl-L-alanine amidase n=1 Tax=Geodermatophilus bullaregiensis TaxID=1564160 RepID=UPI001958D537|nr:N-acetylmuramoyl-L-alanine amidase [Geodermatophilus bullaregiensis]MBM7806966.1 N-acetylmuramoyl-L-alanine amidase [Geodermatophilus bullaregiensis]
MVVLALLAAAVVGLAAWASALQPGSAGAAPEGPAAASTPPPVPSASPAPAATTTPPLPLAGRTVVLDPGHNRDNGSNPSQINRQVDAGGFAKACNTTGTATDSGIPEATVNWELALAVRQRLEAAGARVLLTRDADAGWGPCIDERAAIANREGADLLLSLHADGAVASASGFHVIMPGLLPGWTEDIVADSRRAAVAVRDALVGAGVPPATHPGLDGLDERTDLGTLNRSDVPAVMLEAGNLRNAGDAALLTGAEGRARVADALAAAVTGYFSGSP